MLPIDYDVASYPGVVAVSGLLVFDGDCGFCTSAANLVAQSWPAGCRAVPWQHLGAVGLAEIGLTVEQAQQAAWWVGEDGILFRGHRAIAESLYAGTGWHHTAGAVIRRPPASWAAAALYPLVVRYRYRLPGGSPACRL